MTKRIIVIKDDEKTTEIAVKATIKAMEIYRAEFNGDLIKDLTEANAELNPDPFNEAMKRVQLSASEVTPEIVQQKILENLDLSAYNTEGKIAGEEIQLKVMRIFWAMARAADPQTSGFDSWLDGFDVLPVRQICEKIHQIWIEASTITVEIKN